jgi:hypothetical protein
MPYRAISSKEGGGLDVSVQPQAGPSRYASKMSVLDAHRSLSNLDGVEMTLAEFQAKQGG